jgi:hypothetical protein
MSQTLAMSDLHWDPLESLHLCQDIHAYLDTPRKWPEAPCLPPRSYTGRQVATRRNMARTLDWGFTSRGASTFGPVTVAGRLLWTDTPSTGPNRVRKDSEGETMIRYLAKQKKLTSSNPISDCPFQKAHRHITSSTLLHRCRSLVSEYPKQNIGVHCT